MISRYHLTYICPSTGKIIEAQTTASSKKNAADKLGIVYESITKSKMNINFNKQANIATLIQIVNRLSIFITLGNKNELLSIIRDFKELKANSKAITFEFEKGRQLSEYFHLFGFDAISCAIFKTSADTGNVALGMKSIKDYLKQQQQFEKATKNVIKSNIWYLILIPCTFFGAPFGTKTYFDFMTEYGINYPPNEATHILYFMHEYSIITFFLLFIIVFYILKFTQHFYKIFGNIYPVNIFYNLSRLRHSLTFLLLYSQLFKANTSNFVENFFNAYKDIHPVYNRILKDNSVKGIAVAKSILSIDYHPILHSTFTLFNRKENTTERVEVFKEALENINEDIEQLNRRAKNFINASIQIVLWVMVTILMFGMLLPQFDISGVGI